MTPKNTMIEYNVAKITSSDVMYLVESWMVSEKLVELFGFITVFDDGMG